MSRDPRVDPQPGDVFVKDGTTYRVERILRDGTGDVRMYWKDADEDGSCGVARAYWPKWVKAAKITPPKQERGR